MGSQLDVFSDPQRTVSLLDALVTEFGMTLESFRQLHHLPESTNLTINGHRIYAKRIAASSTGCFQGTNKNVGTARRMAACLTALRSGLPWERAIVAARGQVSLSAKRFAIRSILTRKPIDRAQRAFYKATLDSPDHGFYQDDLEELLSHDGEWSFQSALAALSRRINATPELEEESPGYWYIFSVLNESERRRYVAVPELVEELSVHPGLLAALNKDWPTVLQDEPFVWEPTISSTPERIGDQVDTVDLPSDPSTYELVQRRLRQYQSAFRDQLMLAYGSRCAISGTSVVVVLEAAHIEPHSESGNNSATNGLLLRSDIHALFDSGLLRIHPDNLEMHVDASVEDPEYRQFHGKTLRARQDAVMLSYDALLARWDQ